MGMFFNSKTKPASLQNRQGSGIRLIYGRISWCAAPTALGNMFAYATQSLRTSSLRESGLKA